ncbi:hypothetical protein FZEAL_6408 [Fusarium zealandicum]|uniref:Mid2 domain-containing protein n=1 Tax=Fusarium zealandicum TaxID=1053134 RepID=A0A8H4XIV5_9HYPO|nr:hypothetical protein FZEAL_6408 [Fusarium zealandicum]
MYATRLSQLLLVALAIICVTQATWINMEDLHHNERRIVRRASPSQTSEVEPSSAAASAPSATDKAEDPATAEPTQDDAQPTSEAPAEDTAEPTQATEEPSEPTDSPQASEPTAADPETTAAELVEETTAAAEPTDEATPSSEPEKTTAEDSKPAETAAASTEADASEPTVAPSATNDDSAPASTEEAPETTSAASNGGGKTQDDTNSTEDEPSKTTEVESTQVTAKPVTSTFVEVVTMTNDDGDLETMTTTTKTTSTPGLNSEDNEDSSSGMSPKTRNTVIGVVVGIGGAIVVGVLGLVAWRIWGRKKQNDEADGLMDYNENNGSLSGINGGYSNSSYNGIEKAEPVSAGGTGPQRTPFQSTLDNYHQPAPPVNASSNF